MRTSDFEMTITRPDFLGDPREQEPCRPDEKPVFEQVELYRAGDQNYSVYRIPGIITTSQGTVLVCCEARKSDTRDWGHIDVWLQRSMDGGAHWEGARRILPDEARDSCRKGAQPSDQSGMTINNPTLVADKQNGLVHFLYCLEYARCFHMVSSDEGLTFSAPTEITPVFDRFRADYPWRIIATGPGHGIQLGTGRLVVPVWLGTGGKSGFEHWPSVVSVIYSDDHGASWHCGEIAIRDTEEWVNPNESAVVELMDGSVLLSARNESLPRLRLMTTSRDGIGGWSPPRFQRDLHEPVCMAGLVRHPDGPLLFSNPAGRRIDSGVIHSSHYSKRENLSVSVSMDDGETWQVSRRIATGPSGYSDLAVLPDGTTLCCYEVEGGLAVARFNLAWLLETHPDLTMA